MGLLEEERLNKNAGGVEKQGVGRLVGRYKREKQTKKLNSTSNRGDAGERAETKGGGGERVCPVSEESEAIQGSSRGRSGCGCGPNFLKNKKGGTVKNCDVARRGLFYKVPSLQ